jgi:Amt family ammonium transporter
MKGTFRRWMLMNAILGAMIFAFVAAGFTQEPAKADPTPATAETPAAEAGGEKQEPTPAPPDPVKELADKVAANKVAADTLWTLVTAFLVFFMNLGFACVESGFCRAKNAVNILSKNFIVFAASTFAFWLIGWGLMFGNDGGAEGQGYIGTEGLWMVSGKASDGSEDNSPAISDYKGPYSSISWTGIPLWAKFFFQLVFCGTAATIVSGVVAERIKYKSFIFFTLALAAVIYPVVGHWIWGGGWLQDRGFADFAGSTQVHSIGGWAALAGVLLLGPRIGKYSADGKVNPIPGHNMTAATIGTFILWFGWFGFNPGSTMAADPGAIAEIAATTNMSAAVATLTATITSWLMMGKPDLGMTLNGCLAGLVAITAPCAFVSVGTSAIIGAVAGILVVLSVICFDKIKIDDPVGALSVHLVNGVWGTLAVGLFANHDLIKSRSANPATSGGLFTSLPAGSTHGQAEQFVDQLIGIASAGAYVMVVSLVIWGILKLAMGIRVPAEEETQGLDIGEHGQEAYSGFQMIQK